MTYALKKKVLVSLAAPSCWNEDVSLSYLACLKNLLMGYNKKPVAYNKRQDSKVGHLQKEKEELWERRGPGDLQPRCRGCTVYENAESQPAVWPIQSSVNGLI